MNSPVTLPAWPTFPTSLSKVVVDINTVDMREREEIASVMFRIQQGVSKAVLKSTMDKLADLYDFNYKLGGNFDGKEIATRVTIDMEALPCDAYNEVSYAFDKFIYGDDDE